MYHFGGGISNFDIQIDADEASSSRADSGPSIIFPDKDLLFTADFRRAGDDLLLVGSGKTAVILGYFEDERRPSLTTPEGASLSGATVEALAGPEAPGQYAQAITAAASAARIPIGRVEKVSGSATVLRNGVPVELHLGDVVAKGDVVQTGPDSALSIKFDDGTVFGLSSSARVVLNDMVYAANSTSNSALFTLVEGVVGFVAGKIAKTGDMRVETPVATLAIRGTAVQTEISAASGVVKLSLLTEPDGSAGSFVLLDKNNPSRVITSISDPRVATVLTPVAGSDPLITRVTKTADELRGEGDFVRSLFQVVSPEPRQRRGSIDIDDDPALVPVNLQSLVDPPEFSPIFRPVTPERAPRATVVAIPPPPEPIRGTAIEDGPLVRLVARPDNARPTESAAPPIVQVPASLPAGVKFDEDSQNFALNPSHPAYQHLGQGESATVTVHYTLLINDTPVQTSVSWTVTGRNDDPAAGGDRIAVREVGTRVLAVRANDRDVDGDALEIVSWTAPVAGSVSRNSDGNLVFDPGEDFRHLGAGETAEVSFSYTVSDGQGGTDTTSVTLQVVGRNDAPVAVRDRIAVNEVGEQVLALRANDRDVDGDVLQILDWTAPLGGSVSLNPAGELVFDPGEDFRHLGAGETATVSFAYTVSDGQGGSDTANVALQVVGGNDAPVAAADLATVGEIGTRILAVRANDRDVDGDALEIVSWTAPLAGAVSRNSDGDLVFDPGEDFRHLGAGETAQVSFSYTVSDGQGGTDTANVSLQVVGRNDAPVAVRDRIAVDEAGEQVLALRANDRDVDGDVLQILDWTPPLEGSAFLNSAGDLVFDPGEDFRALGAGETATVSFFYTVSDGQGGTDTASVTLEVIGSGTFSSPPKTASTSGILGFNQQAVSLSIEAPSATTSATADLDLSIGLGPVVQPQMNIVYVVDISGSTSDPFAGTPVGDLNGDGRSNTVLDAEIASLITLTDQVTTLGFSPGDVTITVIPFNSSADPATGSNSGAGPLAAATFSLGGAGEELIADYLRDLDAIASGSTNFTDALRAANDRLQRLDQGNENNFLYFLSDGRGEGPVEAELARLNEVFDTKIAAVGVGANADLDLLNIIDNTDGASLLTAPNQIEVSVLGAPIPSGTITDLDLFVNGAEVIEIGPEDLVSTSDGFALDASLAGLQRLIGRENTVSASVTFASGEILTTQLTIAGALPLSTDLAV